MTNHAPLMHSTVLSPQAKLTPQETERRKTSQEKAEDVVYTLNHSFTCLSVTDTFGLVGAANLYNKIFGTTHNLGHDHNTGYGAEDWAWDRMRGKHNDPKHVHSIHHKEDHRIKHDLEHALEHEAEDIAKGRKPEIHPDPAPKLTPDSSGSQAGKKLWSTTKKWLFAEAVGDLGSVPFTIALQRYAPGFMLGVRHMIEPLISKGFHKTSNRDAKNWGMAHGKDADSPEVKQRAAELYEYEMKHMPQMAVWTVSSIGLNFAAMEVFHKIDPRQYERTSVGEFAKVKGLGALFTAGLVLGVRGLTPGGAHKWDRTIGKHIVVPITKTVGGVFGVNADDVDRFQKQREQQTVGSAETSAPVKTETKEAEPKTEAKPIEPKTTVDSGTTLHTPPLAQMGAAVPLAAGM